MNDVKRLALSGREDLALRAYFEINKDTLEGAKQKIQNIIEETKTTEMIKENR